MGQIFGNTNDPRTREAGRNPFGGSATGVREAETTAPEPPRPFTEEPQPKQSASELPTHAPLVGETIRARKEELERRLAASNRLMVLSQKRAADLTIDELMDLWQNL